MARGLQTRIALGLLSVAGMSAGHFLSYVIASPDAHHRADLLEATGHGGESPFLVVAIAAVVAACIAALVGRPREKAPRLVRSFALLTALQITAFTGLEVTERIGAHVSIAESIQEPVFLLGLGLQVLVAAVAAFILRALHVAATTASPAPPPLPGVIGTIALPAATATPAIDVLRPWDARGPPTSS